MNERAHESTNYEYYEWTKESTIKRKHDEHKLMGTAERNY